MRGRSRVISSFAICREGRDETALPSWSFRACRRYSGLLRYGLGRRRAAACRGAAYRDDMATVAAYGRARRDIAGYDDAFHFAHGYVSPSIRLLTLWARRRGELAGAEEMMAGG